MLVLTFLWTLNSNVQLLRHQLVKLDDPYGYHEGVRGGYEVQISRDGLSLNEGAHHALIVNIGFYQGLYVVRVPHVEGKKILCLATYFFGDRGRPLSYRDQSYAEFASLLGYANKGIR